MTPTILVLVHFGLITIKTKLKYICISNIIQLLSAAGPVPCAEPIPASLVVESSTLISFSVGSNYKFDW